MNTIESKRNLKALVVEDTIFNMELATRMLQALNFIVDGAENGVIALELFETNSYDIIFMDINMPIKDGLEATKEIREREKVLNKPQTPIVAITAAGIDLKEQCFEVGMDYFIAKPLTKEKLDIALSKVIII